MVSPNDGTATDLPRDDGPSGGRYVMGGWDPVAGVWRAVRVFADRSLAVLFAKGTAVNTVVSVGTTSTTVLAANANRKVAFIYNNGAATVYLKSASGAVVATDYPLPAGAEFEDQYTTTIWTAIAASGSADIRVREVS